MRHKFIIIFSSVLTCLTIFSDDTEEILVHKTVVEFDNGGMIKLGGGARSGTVVNTNTLKVQLNEGANSTHQEGSS